jgi:anti-sigma factor RsiW
MIREELEFRIARYADGDLTGAEGLAVEAELAADAEARALLAEYQTLRTAIEEAAGPALPKVHWDRLEQLLSVAVAKAAPGIGAAAGEGDGEEGDGGEGDGEEGDGPFAGAMGVEQEFAVACHADGTLPAERGAAVEQLLVCDPRARALLHEYHDIDAFIKALAYRDAPSAVRWERLARQISGVVDAGANAGLPEDIERQIAALVGGALPAGECDAVEARLAADPAARVRAYEYQNLDAALQAVSAGDSVPAVDWDRFALRISAAIDRQAVLTTVRSHKSREGNYPIVKWLRSPARMALAASVLIGVALAARLMHGDGQAVGPIHVPSKPVVEEIAAFQPEKATGASQSDISIGPPAVADDFAGETGDDDVVSRPPRAFVASGRATPSQAVVLPAMPF